MPPKSDLLDELYGGYWKLPSWDKMVDLGSENASKTTAPRSKSSPNPEESRLFFERLAQSEMIEIINENSGRNCKIPEFLLRSLSGYFDKKCIQLEESGMPVLLSGPPSRSHVLSNFVIWIYAGMRADVIDASIETWLLGEELEALLFQNQIMDLIQEKLSADEKRNDVPEGVDPHPAFDKDLIQYLKLKTENLQGEFSRFLAQPMVRFCLDSSVWKVANDCDETLQLFWEKIVLNGKELGLHLVKETRIYDRDQSLLPPWAKENGGRRMFLDWRCEKGGGNAGKSWESDKGYERRGQFTQSSCYKSSAKPQRSVMEDPNKADAIKELHGEFSRKYRIHATKIEQYWRSFNKDQRTEALKAGFREGEVLKHPKDRSIGDVYKFIPEINLQDITEPESDFLLDHLKHRATKSVYEQYFCGVKGGPGDAAFIMQSMQVNNLRHADPCEYCFTMFLEGEKWGRSFRHKNKADYDETMALMAPAVQAGVCVPQSTGELILLRQLYTLTVLHILIDDILGNGSTTRGVEKPKKPEKVALDALSKLSIVQQPKKLNMQDILASALDQKTSIDDYMRLTFTEPTILTYSLNLWFFSRPELIPDEMGRIMTQVIMEKYISVAIFELVHNLVIANAIWDYLYRLLQILKDEPSDICKRLILQEISNVSSLEYRRLQNVFRRYVQTFSGKGFFKRQSGVNDDFGMARVNLKGKIETFPLTGPQLHPMLRLCLPETKPSGAVAWIKKLDDYNQSNAAGPDAIDAKEMEAFGDLAIIVNFIQSLSTSLPLPAIQPKKGQIFISRSTNLAAELAPLRTQIDLSEFVIPIDNLLEPGMAEGALKALYRFVAEKTGTELGFLYEDLVNDSISELRDYLRQQKERLGGRPENSASQLLTEPIHNASAPEIRVQTRREKEKTRPPHSSIYSLAAQSTKSAESQTVTEKPPQIFRVKKETFQVFSTIFSKSESRGSITWNAFESAMADLSFSVLPKFGSVFTFYPPPNMNVEKSLTLHRPHKSQIEGNILIIFAYRMKRVYGWGEESFEIA